MFIYSRHWLSSVANTTIPDMDQEDTWVCKSVLPEEGTSVLPEGGRLIRKRGASATRRIVALALPPIFAASP